MTKKIYRAKLHFLRETTGKFWLNIFCLQYIFHAERTEIQYLAGVSFFYCLISVRNKRQKILHHKTTINIVWAQCIISWYTWPDFTVLHARYDGWIYTNQRGSYRALHRNLQRRPHMKESVDINIMFLLSRSLRLVSFSSRLVLASSTWLCVRRWRWCTILTIRPNIIWRPLAALEKSLIFKSGNLFHSHVFCKTRIRPCFVGSMSSDGNHF